MLYRVGDHVLLRGRDHGLEDHSEYVVVRIEGSTSMLKRGHQVIRGVHADEVVPSHGFVNRAPAASANTGGRTVLLT